MALDELAIVYEDFVQRSVKDGMSCTETGDLAMFGLAGEVGELVELWKKERFHNKPAHPDRVREELGDILWYFSLALSVFDFDLSDVMVNNMLKLHARRGTPLFLHEEDPRA